MRPRPLACSTQAANVTIDLRDRVPSSGIGTACQYHKEQYQHFALSILSCPMQTALQIILSEPQILLEKLDQLSFQGSHEYSCVRTEFFPRFHLRILHTLQFSISLFNLSTTVSRSLKTAQRPARISPRLNVSENKKH